MWMHKSVILLLLTQSDNAFSYHSGGIADFQHKIKRKLQNALSDELYSFPSGSTDSEWGQLCSALPVTSVL